MKYKKKLKQALKAAGLDEDLADYINLTSEDQIEEIIEKLETDTSEDEIDFSKVLKSKEFSEFVSKKGLDEVLKTSPTLQKGFDKKVTAGIKKFKKKYFEEDELDEDDPKEDLSEGGKGDSETLKLIKELKKEIQDIKKGSTDSEKLDTAKKLFSESETLKDLPEKLKARYLKNIDIDSETSVEDQIKEFETEAADLNISKKPGSPGLPQGSSTGNKKKVSEDQANKLVDSLI